MTEMRKSEAKESEVNHRFVEHAQWYGCFWHDRIACQHLQMHSVLHRQTGSLLLLVTCLESAHDVSRIC